MPLSADALGQVLEAARARWPGSTWFDRSPQERFDAVLSEIGRLMPTSSLDRGLMDDFTK